MVGVCGCGRVGSVGVCPLALGYSWIYSVGCWLYLVILCWLLVFCFLFSVKISALLIFQ